MRANIVQILTGKGPASNGIGTTGRAGDQGFFVKGYLLQKFGATPDGRHGLGIARKTGAVVDMMEMVEMVE